MVPLLLLIGEVTPKTIAVSFPVKFTTGLSARILPRWIVLITPLREVVRVVADRITTFIVGDAVNRENILHADELKTLLEESEETGVIDATERVLIDNVLEASETDISRIMTPSPRINFSRCRACRFPNCWSCFGSSVIREFRFSRATGTTSSASCTPRIC